MKKRINSCVFMVWIVASFLLLSFAVAAQQSLLENDLADIPSSMGTSASPPPVPSTSERSVLTAWGDIDNTGIEGNGGTDNGTAYNDAPATEEMYLTILAVIVYGIVRRRKLKMKNEE